MSCSPIFVAAGLGKVAIVEFDMVDEANLRGRSIWLE